MPEAGGGETWPCVVQEQRLQRHGRVLCRSCQGSPLPQKGAGRAGTGAGSSGTRSVAVCCILAGVHEGLRGALGTRGGPALRPQAWAGSQGRGLCWPEAAAVGIDGVVEADDGGVGGSAEHRARVVQGCLGGQGSS